MNKRKNHSRLLSLRSALAVSGAALMTLTLSQIADTQAAFTDTATANVSTLATGNYNPTPLTTSVNCSTSGGANLLGRRANLSWPAVSGATGYVVRLVYGDGSLYKEYPAQTTTSLGGISTTSPRASVYARVHTLNDTARSTGWTGANTAISYKDLTSSRTECENGPSPSQANQTWENQSTWNPVSGASARMSIRPEGGGPLGGPDPVEATPTPTPSETSSTTNPPTSTSVPTTSPTTSQPAPTTPDATTTSPSTTTPTTTMPSVTTPSETSQATSTTTSATSRPAASPVDLGDGLTAKLVDRGSVRTVVLVSDGTEQCSAEIPRAEALDNGGAGKLTVTDSDGNVHYVDTSNCSTS